MLYLIQKEFKQILRNSFMPRLIIAFPLMAVLVMPFAANLEVKNVNLGIIDLDSSPTSQALIHKLESSPYFHLALFSHDVREGGACIDSNKCDIVLSLPNHFERDMFHSAAGSANGESFASGGLGGVGLGAHIAITANAINSTKGLLGSSYVNSILMEFGREMFAAKGAQGGTMGEMGALDSQRLESRPNNGTLENLDSAKCKNSIMDCHEVAPTSRNDSLDANSQTGRNIESQTQRANAFASQNLESSNSKSTMSVVGLTQTESHNSKNMASLDIQASRGSITTQKEFKSAQNAVSLENKRSAVSLEKPTQILSTYEFNPNLDYKRYMIPALMVMVLTMICGFLPALNIVGEKERGNIEQLNVTPISKFRLIFSKLVPYWVIGLIVLSLCFVAIWLCYGLIPRESVLKSYALIYLFALLYILVVAGMGLVISNYSNTMQQAMFVIFFFVLVLVLMSGLFTSIKAMPEWARLLSYFNPLRYFMESLRLIFLKSSSLFDIWHNLVALVGFAVFFNLWAVLSYKKRS